MSAPSLLEIAQSFPPTHRYHRFLTDQMANITSLEQRLETAQQMLQALLGVEAEDLDFVIRYRQPLYDYLHACAQKEIPR